MSFKAHHVSLAVKDLQESIRWYKDIFEFRLAHEYNKEKWHIALLELNDFHIELIQLENNKALPDYRKDIMSDIATIGTKHVCFQVEDLKETLANLKTKGVELATEVDSAAFGGSFAFVKDCNGILIEIYEKE